MIIPLCIFLINCTSVFLFHAFNWFVSWYVKSVELERLAVYFDSDINPWHIDKPWTDLLPQEWVKVPFKCSSCHLVPALYDLFLFLNLVQILRFSDMEQLMVNLLITSKSILTFCNQWLGTLSSRNSALILHVIIRTLFKRQSWLWMMWLFVCQRLVLLTSLLCFLCLIQCVINSSLYWLFYLLWYVLQNGYRDLLKLAENFAAFNQRLNYAHLRPHVPVKSDPRSWWKYAYQVLSVQIKKARYLTSFFKN